MHKTAWKAAGTKFIKKRTAGVYIEYRKEYYGLVSKWNEILVDSPCQRNITPSSLKAAVDCGDFGISPTYRIFSSSLMTQGWKAKVLEMVIKGLEIHATMSQQS